MASKVKLFRDPLYNYNGFEKERDRWLLDLIDSPEMQRLRRIHQLGVSYYTYPGADHNRLAHSLGVVHLMQRVVGGLERSWDAERVQSARMRLLAAALLHDVGHGPFSHLFEPCLKIDHEEWSIALILSPESRINEILTREDGYLPGQVADLIRSKSPRAVPWHKALLSSQLDVDRLDYLRRDSLSTGAGYGHFDWFRLITSLEFWGDQNDLVWPEKSALAIEEYIFARFYMYQNVYHHKTTRGFERLIQAMWSRASQLRENHNEPFAIPVLDALWKQRHTPPLEVPVQTFLDVEEHSVLSQIQAWRSHTDKVLADFSRRFLCRDGLVMVEPPPPQDPLAPEYEEWEKEVHGILRRAGFDPPGEYCLKDTLQGKYRRPYHPETEPGNQTSVNAIRVLVGTDAVEISTFLPRLRAVTQLPADKLRYYVPREVRNAVMELTQSWPR